MVGTKERVLLWCSVFEKGAVMFMNEYEIDDALARAEGNTVQLAAARTLANLRDCANANSDGWAYWPKPSRAATRLCGLLERVRRGDGETITRSEVRKAYTPIRAFLTRSGLQCEIVEV
jgi:hypothetical protein